MIRDEDTLGKSKGFKITKWRQSSQIFIYNEAVGLRSGEGICSRVMKLGAAWTSVQSITQLE